MALLNAVINYYVVNKKKKKKKKNPYVHHDTYQGQLENHVRGADSM